jgi:hypothetical protein
MARITIQRPDAEVLAHARAKRDRLLAASDWTQAPDNRLTAEQREAWREARESWRARVDDIKAGKSPRPWAAAPE